MAMKKTTTTTTTEPKIKNVTFLHPLRLGGFSNTSKVASDKFTLDVNWTRRYVTVQTSRNLKQVIPFENVQAIELEDTDE